MLHQLALTVPPEVIHLFIRQTVFFVVARLELVTRLLVAVIDVWSALLALDHVSRVFGHHLHHGFFLGFMLERGLLETHQLDLLTRALLEQSRLVWCQYTVQFIEGADHSLSLMRHVG